LFNGAVDHTIQNEFIFFKSRAHNEKRPIEIPLHLELKLNLKNVKTSSEIAKMKRSKKYILKNSKKKETIVKLSTILDFFRWNEKILLDSTSGYSKWILFFNQMRDD
jgi:thiamine biosynthesis protein ThiC